MGEIFEEQLYTQLQQVTKDITIKKNEPLRNHTTFKIGGPADYFIETKDASVIREIIKLCKQEKVPYFILGNGSDLLFSDNGYPGVIIHIIDEDKEIITENVGHKVFVTGKSGILLSDFAIEIANRGLTGFEFAAGIPGTLGGAVYMNAGAYGGEIKDCIEYADVLTEDGEILRLSKEDLKLSYRNSIIQKEKYIILSACFSFVYGEKEEILAKITDLNQRRKDKQPLEYPSAGSTFMRPEGYFAGKLIMDAGLRGFRVGDAMVSEKHCGFVINCGNATAEDVKQLIKEITRIVNEKFGVTLQPEVKIIDEKRL